MSDGAGGTGGTGAGVPARDDRSRAKLAGALGLLILVVVAVVLIFWPRPVTVPDVVGMAETTARQTVTAAGFSVGAVATRTVETSANGTVLEQDPPGGTSAAAGSPVALTVGVVGGPSAGAPLSSLAAPTSDVQVPGVVGQTEANAVTALSGAGFRVTSSSGSGNQPVGSVLSQFPEGGVMAPSGSTVQITISTGTSTSGNAVANGPGGRTVPNVLGMTRAGASRTLSNAGFSMSVVYAPSTTTASGLVFYQTPQPGPSGGSPSRVTAWISTGSPTHGRPYPVPPGEN